MYTANIVDTVIFRSLGKSLNPHVQSLKAAVERAGTELWVPSPIYRELTNYGTEPPVNPYLDDGIEEGWIRVAIPLAGNRDDAYESLIDPVEQAHHLTDEFLNQQSKYPTTNNCQFAVLSATG